MTYVTIATGVKPSDAVSVAVDRWRSLICRDHLPMEPRVTLKGLVLRLNVTFTQNLYNLYVSFRIFLYFKLVIL